jgi:hypothetical protein
VLTRPPAQVMHRNGKDFTVIKLMQPGVYQARRAHAASRSGFLQP